MASIKVHLTFPEKLIKDPVIYNLGKQYNVVTNIRRANVDQKVGWVDLELTGTEEDMKEGIKYLESLEVEVDLIEGDIVES
ncbi:MAG: FeS-binding protein [Actinobacteria bacterium]|nr:MAG: FeS-binding protein [Actinomycetota bacterium]